MVNQLQCLWLYYTHVSATGLFVAIYYYNTTSSITTQSKDAPLPLRLTAFLVYCLACEVYQVSFE